MPLTLAKDLKPVQRHEDVLDYLDSLIVAANKDGKKSIRTYGPDGVFGSSEAYNGDTPFVKEVLESLRNAGYVASVMVDCKQFVDIYLLISWE